MNRIYLTFSKRLLNILKYILVGLWVFLTIIVIIFLIDRWLNPGWKGISNRDLKDYGIISLIFFAILGLFKFLTFTISEKLNR